MRKTFCDRCEGEVSKLPSIVKASGKDAELCNRCWSGFVKFMGSPFYKGQLSKRKPNPEELDK